MISSIEASHRRVEADIGLGEGFTQQERLAMLLEDALEAIERREQRVDVLVVGLLGAREPAPVDAVVDVAVDPLVEGVDVGPQVGRVQAAAGAVRLAELRGGDEVVELRRQHADDLARLVVNERGGLLVPQDRDGDAPLEPRVRLQVQLAQRLEPVERVLGERAVRAVEEPPLRPHERVQDVQVDHVLELLQGSHDQGAVRLLYGKKGGDD